MSSALHDELRRKVQERKAVFVVGAGVSISAVDPASNDANVTSWYGLLANGIDYCASIGLHDASWVQIRKQQLSREELEEKLSVAELISTSLKAPYGDFVAWLAASVGHLRAKRKEVVEALFRLDCPVTTTNYDDILEQVSHLPPATWRNPAMIKQCLDQSPAAVGHIHGYWRDAESVVLSIRNYESYLASTPMRELMKSLFIERTVIFVGCGGGLTDPNFSALLRWCEQAIQRLPVRHFRLCTSKELPTVRKEHSQDSRVFPLAYGEEYSDLGRYLKSLLPAIRQPISILTNDANDNGDLNDAVPGGVATQVGNLDVEIVLDRDFQSYSDEEQERFLSQIARLLELSPRELKVKRKTRGSVRLTLEIPADLIERLRFAVARGDLDEFGVTKIITSTPSKHATDASTRYAAARGATGLIKTYGEGARNAPMQHKEIEIVTGAPPLNDTQVDQIFEAVVASVDERSGVVMMDIGGESLGVVPVAEFGDRLPADGDKFEIVYDGLDEQNRAVFSRRRADRLRAWERFSQKYKEGDEIQGICTRKIKGGLLVDVDGLNVLLPAGQVNLRRTYDFGEFIGEPIRARIIKIDPRRMNIVISRRKLLEEERQKQREFLLSDIHEGQTRVGVVKSIADFGVFVDLGGIDGLLHITDMTWGHINHPSEMVALGQAIEVVVLRVDTERERIAIGLKQKQVSPWEGIESRYPVNSKHLGEVANIMSYGAFVKLEDGVEGLVHVSEMSWTRRINHPSEIVRVGDKAQVVVLECNKEKREISLGMKQAEANPWETIEQRFPVGAVIEGTVLSFVSWGAFVEIADGVEGLLHVSDMSWSEKISHPSEMVKKGDKLRCIVLNVDTQRQRIALGYKQLKADPLT